MGNWGLGETEKGKARGLEPQSRCLSNLKAPERRLRKILQTKDFSPLPSTDSDQKGQCPSGTLTPGMN
jgi:hypothetical protein